MCGFHLGERGERERSEMRSFLELGTISVQFYGKRDGTSFTLRIISVPHFERKGKEIGNVVPFVGTNFCVRSVLFSFVSQRRKQGKLHPKKKNSARMQPEIHFSYVDGV